MVILTGWPLFYCGLEPGSWHDMRRRRCSRILSNSGQGCWSLLMAAVVKDVAATVLVAVVAGGIWVPVIEVPW